MSNEIPDVNGAITLDRVLHLKEILTPAAAPTDHLAIYAKEVGGVPTLHVRAQGAELVISTTASGAVGGSGVANQLAYWSSTSDIAGDGALTWDATNNKLAIASGTVTTSQPPLTITQTWNAGGVTFVGMLLDITNTASGGASNVVEWRIGGNPRFEMRNDGEVRLSSSSGAGLSLSVFGRISATGTASGTTPQFIISSASDAGMAIGGGVLTSAGERIRIVGPRSSSGVAGSATQRPLVLLQDAGTYAFQTNPQTGDVYAWDFRQVTFTNPSAGTVAQAATMYLAGAPIAGANVTITNNYAIWADAGLNRFDGNGTHVFELPADATGNATGATGRVPIKVGAGTVYLRYYAD